MEWGSLPGGFGGVCQEGLEELRLCPAFRALGDARSGLRSAPATRPWLFPAPCPRDEDAGRRASLAERCWTYGCPHPLPPPLPRRGSPAAAAAPGAGGCARRGAARTERCPGRAPSPGPCPGTAERAPGSAAVPGALPSPAVPAEPVAEARGRYSLSASRSSGSVNPSCSKLRDSPALPLVPAARAVLPHQGRKSCPEEAAPDGRC